VEVNDPLVELETDKVAVEVPAPAAGVLREILLKRDEEAAPGAIWGELPCSRKWLRTILPPRPLRSNRGVGRREHPRRKGSNLL
jgi:2-oxoglutarate dehydrogenase E2 component (dihydrolipoamide succinyltransferase)